MNASRYTCQIFTQLLRRFNENIQQVKIPGPLHFNTRCRDGNCMFFNYIATNLSIKIHTLFPGTRSQNQYQQEM